MTPRRTTRTNHLIAGLASGALAVSGLLAAIAGSLSALAATSSRSAPAAISNPFGSNVTIFSPSTPVASINAALNVPSTGPREFLFMPGTYGSAAGQNDPSTATGIINATLGADTVVAGLGASPDDVVINGALDVTGTGYAPLDTFTRSLENLTINPIEPGLPAHAMDWVTSQQSPWRRVNLEGSVDISNTPAGAFAFGNVFANSKISGIINDANAQNTTAGSGVESNAMYDVQNSQIGGFTGFSMLMEFTGVKGAPKDDFGPATSTRGPGDVVSLPTTPVTREAPFLYVRHGRYYLFVPKAQTSTSGYDWALNRSTGTSVPLSRFYIAQPTDNVTLSGLWLEHFKKTQMTWNGQGGRVVFLENEPPYTPPSQAQWMDGNNDGYPSVKISDNVTKFTLDGFLTATRFSNGCDCYASSAIETPVSKNVTFHGVIAGSIEFPVPAGTTPTGFTVGGYQHVFNNIGPAVDAGVASGTSKLPYSDVFGLTADQRIAWFPDNRGDEG